VLKQIGLGHLRWLIPQMEKCMLGMKLLLLGLKSFHPLNKTKIC